MTKKKEFAFQMQIIKETELINKDKNGELQYRSVRGPILQQFLECAAVRFRNIPRCIEFPIDRLLARRSDNRTACTHEVPVLNKLQVLYKFVASDIKTHYRSV